MAALLLIFSNTCLAEAWQLIVYTKNIDKVYVDFDSIKYEPADAKGIRVLTYCRNSVLEEKGKDNLLAELPFEKREEFQNINSIIQIYGVCWNDDQEMLSAVYENTYIDLDNNVIKTEKVDPVWEKLAPYSRQYGINTYPLSYAYKNFQKVLARSTCGDHNKTSKNDN